MTEVELDYLVDHSRCSRPGFEQERERVGVEHGIIQGQQVDSKRRSR